MLIELRDIRKIYQMGEVQVRALGGVNLDVEKGELTSIMGPSGSGKSTLMNVIGLLDQPTSGEYYLEGSDVAKLGENELARIRNKRIGFVFQSYNLLSRTTALDNVELPLIYSGAKNRRRMAIEALETVGLGDRVHHRPNELSGGQQQRVAIARALVNQPDIILADEPTGNLDTKTGLEIVDLFQRLNEERRITVLFVTHDAEIAQFTRRVIHIRDGAIEQNEHNDRPLRARDVLQELLASQAEEPAAGVPANGDSAAGDLAAGDSAAGAEALAEALVRDGSSGEGR